MLRSMIVADRRRNDSERPRRGKHKLAVRLVAALHGMNHVCRDFRIGTRTEGFTTGPAVAYDDCPGDNHDSLGRGMLVRRWRVSSRKPAKHPVLASLGISPQQRSLN